MTARDLIVVADMIRSEQNLSQQKWSNVAGMDSVGVTVGRIYRRGDCKLSQMNQLLEPLGYELRIVKKECAP